MMMMQMWFYWGFDCTFLFDFFKTGKDDAFWFILGCIITCLFSFLGPVLQYFKIQQKEKSKPGAVQLLLLQLIIFVHSAFNMLLIMTYNYAVVLAVILGYMIGYLTLILEKEASSDQKHSIHHHC